MRVLGVETSCDETAAAVIDWSEDRAVVLSDVVHSQVDIHALYGGVVPELASRDHLARSLPVIDEALRRADASLESIDVFAATSGPGLIGALLVGVQVTKALAWARGKPIVGVNHLVGHALAIQLSEKRPAFPYLALVASGGHTALYDVTSASTIHAMGHTLDDAAGEAFDKVGKMMGLAYPAGAAIDKLALGGDPRRYKFPRPMKQRASLDFSFSGVKTAVLRHIELHGMPKDRDLADVCASFQEAVCDSLVTKTLHAAEKAGRDRIVLGGGVGANSRLRGMLEERGKRDGAEVFLAAPKLCTDNGAMIALAGACSFAARGGDSMTLNADAGWRI